MCVSDLILNNQRTKRCAARIARRVPQVSRYLRRCVVTRRHYHPVHWNLLQSAGIGDILDRGSANNMSVKTM